jgi:hypothetical protein
MELPKTFVQSLRERVTERVHYIIDQDYNYSQKLKAAYTTVVTTALKNHSNSGTFIGVGEANYGELFKEIFASFQATDYYKFISHRIRSQLPKLDSVSSKQSYIAKILNYLFETPLNAQLNLTLLTAFEYRYITPTTRHIIWKACLVIYSHSKTTPSSLMQRKDSKKEKSIYTHKEANNLSAKFMQK